MPFEHLIERQEHQRILWLTGMSNIHPHGLSGISKDLIPPILDQAYNIPYIDWDMRSQRNT